MNVDQSLRSVAGRVIFPEERDVSEAVVSRLLAPAPLPWWRSRVVMATAATAAAVLLVVGLVPAVREEVASWLGISGVTIETVPSVTNPPPPATEAPVPSVTVTTLLPVDEVAEGLGAGLVLGREVVDPAATAGFDVLYPAGEPPSRQFVDEGSRVWLLYAASPILPEMQVPGVGMIVTEFEADSSGIIKQISDGFLDFVEFGDGILGVWLPGPHELVLPDAEGSAVNGRSAGNTLLWEDGGITFRIETALSLQEAIAIAESFR